MIDKVGKAITVANDIRTASLSKFFGGKQAISDVSFTIQPASITGFLGPNGAGKSTTINILLGFIKASFGLAKISDQRISANNISALKDVGFVASNTALDNGFTVWRELKYFAKLSGKKVKNDEIKKMARKLQVNLRAKIGKLSSGNHQKVALMIAMLGKPKVLILDEPTNGLDPLVVSEFKKILLDLKKNGTTIFISSHILGDVEDVCDHFIFIKDGRILAHKSKIELQKLSPTIITLSSNKISDVVFEVKNAYNNEVKIEIPTSETIKITLHNDDINPLVKALSKNKLWDLQIKSQSLETTFMGFYKPNAEGDDEIAQAFHVLAKGKRDLKKAKKSATSEAKEEKKK